jgi:ribosome biogenesis GTPase A
MPNFWRIVNSVIADAEIILLILDARMPNLTRHKEIEQKIRQRGKKLLYVFNKCDLVPKDEMEKLSKGLEPSVFVSSKDKLGGTLLFKKIMQIAHGKDCVVGVLGYPNVGKSSVINLLKGRGSASVSSQAGHTRGVQFVKAKGKIKLMDTPGVFPFNEKDELKQLMIASINPQNVKEPDYYAMKLVEMHPKLFELFYDVKYEGDAYDFIEKVALKRHILKKGKEPDVPRLSVQLLREWQRGDLQEKFIKSPE